MNLKQIEERMAAIKDELQQEDVDVTALRKEFDELKEKRDAILAEAEERKQLLDDIANERVGTKVTIDALKPDAVRSESFENKEDALRSEAYASAFTKRFTEENPQYSDVEKRALNTTNGAALIPHKWLPEIWDAIKESHPILDDLNWQSINAIVEIPKRVAITSGDAAVVEEGQCAVGEENEFVSVKVDLIEIQKMLEITAKMGMLLPEAFKTWLVNEVRDRIGHQMAVEAIKLIKSETAADNKITATTPGKVSVADITELYGLAEGAGTPKVYANRKTVFKNLYSIEGATGQDAYIPNMNDAIKGNLIGVEVKQESGMVDGEVLIVFPQDVFFNVPEGIRVKQMEDECFKLKISGITFMGLVLKDGRAAALLTVGQAG